MIKFAGDIIVLHMCSKDHNHMMYISWDTEWDRQNFLSFWVIFFPLKILKKKKKMPGDVYHKWRSFDVWFLKYKVRQTEIFVILGYFLPFQPPGNLENKNFKIEKKNNWRHYHFTYLNHKWKWYDIWLLIYEAWQKEFFAILDRF